MISKIPAVLLAFVVIVSVGAVAIANPDAEPMACPSVTSQRVEKTAGAAAGYPASCALPTCRIMNSTASKTALVADPFCPFCPAVPVLQWKYQVKLGSVPANACPSDVVAGPWKQP
jgi:hypothetical protein